MAAELTGRRARPDAAAPQRERLPMPDHRATPEDLICRESVDLPQGAAFLLLLSPPGSAAGAALADRVRGMRMGLAIRDAPDGVRTADRGWSLDRTKSYLPHGHAGGRGVGLPSR